jgi:hypothetical protein
MTALATKFIRRRITAATIRANDFKLCAALAAEFLVIGIQGLASRAFQSYALRLKG